MTQEEKISNNIKDKWQQYSPLIGIVLIITGLLFLLDQRIKTNWLSLSLPVVISLILVATGLINKKRLFLISGYSCLGISSAFLIIFQQIFQPDKRSLLIGVGLAAFSLSWFLMFLTILLIKKNKSWWALFVATISAAVSINFFLPNQLLLNYVFLICLAIGSVFLLWGGVKKLLGLIIPGLLISTIGSGIYFAWSGINPGNGLQETGTMLVWFALGWILITVVSKIYSRKFVWWPLIPGGVLTMVGSGLYIGGNPENALGFFQNTGSIGLIMFGIYLILLKYGMKNK